MWIAKPIDALSSEEQKGWVECQRLLRARGEPVPLSQTLVWARAAQSLGGSSYLIMNLKEGVGGILHSTEAFAQAPKNFECTNGPLLDWNSQGLPRQLATFAMAASKLSRCFECVSLRPRWENRVFEERFLALPVEAQSVSQAATLQVRIAQSPREQEDAVLPRLKRSLVRSRKEGVVARLYRAEPETIGEFVQEMKAYGAEHGFYVPELAWFQALLSENQSAEGVSFLRVDSESADLAASSHLLICMTPECAHYLFGYDQREEGVPAAISTAAVAHFRVLDECRRMGLPCYDLNGFTVADSYESSSYEGVSKFKAQFNGEVIEYASPELVINT